MGRFQFDGYLFGTLDGGLQKCDAHVRRRELWAIYLLENRQERGHLTVPSRPYQILRMGLKSCRRGSVTGQQSGRVLFHPDNNVGLAIRPRLLLISIFFYLLFLGTRRQAANG